jgi:hypothetical protein
MNISFALVIATTLVFFQMPARASNISPTQRWCRVYDHTSFTGIPGQCGTILPFYPRKLYAIFENAIVSLLPKLLLPIAMAAHDRRSIPTSQSR